MPRWHHGSRAAKLRLDWPYRSVTLLPGRYASGLHPIRPGASASIRRNAHTNTHFTTKTGARVSRQPLMNGKTGILQVDQINDRGRFRAGTSLRVQTNPPPSKGRPANSRCRDIAAAGYHRRSRDAHWCDPILKQAWQALRLGNDADIAPLVAPRLPSRRLRPHSGRRYCSLGSGDQEGFRGADRRLPHLSWDIELEVGQAVRQCGSARESLRPVVITTLSGMPICGPCLAACCDFNGPHIWQNKGLLSPSTTTRRHAKCMTHRY